MKTGIGGKSGLYIFIVLSFLAMGSCKKDDNGSGDGDGTGYYMRFKMNGTQVEYKGQAEGNFNKGTNVQYVASLAGLKETLVAGKNNMTLVMGTDGENKTGVNYTNYSTTTAGAEKAKLLTIVYLDENGQSYMSWPEEFAPALPVGTEINAQLKVTEATTAYLKGNFSGTLYNTDYSVKLTITDGEFYLRRIQ